MANPVSRKFFLLWLFAAFLALAAAAIGYFRGGEVNAVALTLVVVFGAMSVVSRSKNRGPDT